MREIEDIEFDVIELAYKRKRPVALMLVPRRNDLGFALRRVNDLPKWGMKNLIGVYDHTSPPCQIAEDIRIFLKERKQHGIEEHCQTD